VRDATGALRHPRRRLEARVRALGQPDADRDGTAELKASRLHARTAWIESQYSTYPPLQNEYHPEPYEQLARVWRTTGSLDEANSAIFEKIKMQGRLRPDPQWPGSKQRYYRFKRSLYSLLVASGVGAAVVRPARMFAIFLAVWIAGVFALYAAPDALKVKISPVIPVVSTAGGAAHVVLPASEVARSREEVACGHRASKVVYPLDLMIPFVDLGQEARCEFSLTSQGWGIAQGLYELLGWLLTGGVLLAFSGLVRRQFER
jgi:hypothetical protein